MVKLDSQVQNRAEALETASIDVFPLTNPPATSQFLPKSSPKRVEITSKLASTTKATSPRVQSTAESSGNASPLTQNGAWANSTSTTFKSETSETPATSTTPFLPKSSPRREKITSKLANTTKATSPRVQSTTESSGNASSETQNGAWANSTTTFKSETSSVPPTKDVTIDETTTIADSDETTTVAVSDGTTTSAVSDGTTTSAVSDETTTIGSTIRNADTVSIDHTESESTTFKEELTTTTEKQTDKIQETTGTTGSGSDGSSCPSADFFAQNITQNLSGLIN